VQLPSPFTIKDCSFLLAIESHEDWKPGQLSIRSTIEPHRHLFSIRKVHVGRGKTSWTVIGGIGSLLPLLLVAGPDGGILMFLGSMARNTSLSIAALGV